MNGEERVVERSWKGIKIISFNTRSQVFKFGPSGKLWTGFKSLREAKVGKNGKKVFLIARKKKKRKNRLEKRKNEKKGKTMIVFEQGRVYFHSRSSSFWPVHKFARELWFIVTPYLGAKTFGQHGASSVQWFTSLGEERSNLCIWLAESAFVHC